MQVEKKNYFLELSDEVIFPILNELDTKTLFILSETDKTIQAYVFSKLIFDLKIPVKQDLSSYSQVIKHYRTHCNYFFRMPSRDFLDGNSDFLNYFPNRSKYLVNTPDLSKCTTLV